MEIRLLQFCSVFAHLPNLEGAHGECPESEDASLLLSVKIVSQWGLDLVFQSMNRKYGTNVVLSMSAVLE